MAMGTIERALADIRHGRAVMVVDDIGPDVEATLVAAIESATPRTLMDMATAAGDRLVSVTVDGQSVGKELPATVTIEPSSASVDGVLRRLGAAEAAVDLARLAGLSPIAVMAMVGGDALAAPLDIPLGSAGSKRYATIRLVQLMAYRIRHERLVRRVTEPITLPTPDGTFQMIGYLDVTSGTEHVVLLGRRSDLGPVLVRVHSECLTGDVFGSRRCDCGEQLNAAMRRIAREGGVIIYLRQHEGRGIGLHNKLRAYKLQEEGLDTVEANRRLGFAADLRDFGIAGEILHDLGLREIRLLTNNPEKARLIFSAPELDLTLIETVPLAIEPNDHNRRYLETKAAKMGHHLRFQK